MAYSSAANKIDHPTLIADRYRVEDIIGSGGMAVVYRVYDTHTERQLALKQLKLTDHSEKNREISELFEHEYHILSQLSHPCVIEVYEYGKDDTLPYYTMEILDGSELRELSPLPFQRACSLMLDVCSALSLLHSRRQLHRDLSPRNIHCTKDNRAKLIDFGTIMPMGPCKRVIGTPAFVAPETVGLLDLDARSDLFSLGATLYFALTGKSPYPAKIFNQVREIWRMNPRPPSMWVEDIPKDLDQLVLSMIHIDPMARPTNTAVIMEQLSAIAGIELDERLVLYHAYPTTPALIGRERAMSRFKKRVVRTLGGHGSVVCIEGASGVGRSRFLNACILKAKISGALILRADESDARQGDWGLVRTLSLQLLEAAPDTVSRITETQRQVLSLIVPEIVGGNDKDCHSDSTSSISIDVNAFSEGKHGNRSRLCEIWARAYSTQPPRPENCPDISIRPQGNPQQQREQLQKALGQWMIQASDDRCLMLAIDDFHRIDEPSAAFLVLLAREIEEQKILMAVTVDNEASCAYDETLKLLRDKSSRIDLRNLKPNHTERLIGSVFGESANLRRIADWFQTVSGGNPGIIMQLAQHLIDQSIVRYQAGSWILPENIDTSELPKSLNDALAQRVQRVSLQTRELAQTMALSPEQSFTLEECSDLTTHGDKSKVFKILDELIAAEIISADNSLITFGHKGWVSAFTEQMRPEEKAACHLRLVKVFERRGNNDFRVAQHLLAAGQQKQALDRFIEFAENSRNLSDEDPSTLTRLFQSLPTNWDDTLAVAIQLARQNNYPRKQIYKLQMRLCILEVFIAYPNLSHQIELLSELVRDSGLVTYYELDDSIPTVQRLTQALEQTQKRYDASVESEQGIAPIDAIKELARVLLQAGSIAGRTMDLTYWDLVPSLEPLVPLSPALDVVHKVVRAVHNMSLGHFQQAREVAAEIVERLEQPDQGGMEKMHATMTRFGMMHSLGVYDAIVGRESALSWAQQIESAPLMTISAYRVRMLYYLWQCDCRTAELWKEQTDTLRIQQINFLNGRVTHIFSEIMAYCLSDDLLGIKHALDEIERIAEIYPGWKAVRCYARGEYQRIRGNLSGALRELDEALRFSTPGRYRGWVTASGAYVKTLNGLGRCHEAVREGRKLLQMAQRESLDYLCSYIRMPLAVAEAQVGDFQQAIGTAQTAIDSFKELGSTGLNLGLAYESRAMVAIPMDDQEEFKRYCELCAEQFRVGENPVLTAKYERLLQEADRIISGGAHSPLLGIVDSQNGDSAVLSEIAEMLKDANSPEERAELTLKRLAQASKSRGGYLYLLRSEEPTLVAQLEVAEVSVGIDEQVREFLSNEINCVADITMTCDQDDKSSKFTTYWIGQEQLSGRLSPVVLGHPTASGYVVTGLALLINDSSNDYRFPADIIECISKALSDIGDVSIVRTKTE